ncbi:MAG: hypothetical protein Q8Q28_18055, partial [Pseudomonadota bacterium]|nr:hypothetical protein [Pseudomonadota bacterium]
MAFDSLLVAGGPATWRLLDPYGRDVLGYKDLAVDQAAFLLATPGAYTLLVEGRAGNTAVVGYGFQFNYVGNLPQAGLPAGNPMALGSVVADSLATTGTSKVYRFTLAQDSVLLFDTQTTSGNFTWSLAGPRGQEVNGVSLYASDSGYRNPVQALPAGDYALTIKAQYGSGAYAFRLLDASNFPLLALGQQVSVSRSPANSTLGYRFSAAVGETFVITRQSGDGYWRVIDPYGKVVFGQYYDYTSTPFMASATGTYTLVNEGTYNQTGSVSTSFRLNKRIKQTEALALNDKVTGSLAGAHESDQYSFTLTAPTTLVLDVLENPSARADYIGWTITGSGASNRSLSRNDPVTLGPGQYALTVRGSDSQPHDYQFRMLTREVATVMALNVPLSGVLTPDASTLLYRFDASKGQRLYLDGQDASSSYSYAYWRLTDAFGKSVASGYTYSGSSPFTLPSTGEYLLSVQYSFRDDTAS